MEALHLLQVILHRYIISYNRAFHKDSATDFKTIISDKKPKNKNAMSIVKHDGKTYHQKTISQKVEF